MPFVSGSGDEHEENAEIGSGAPPAFDFDPNDPDQVKVHYDLTGWNFEQRAELSETLAEIGIPHIWEGEELVVPEEIESDVDALFDRLEHEIGPFPVVLPDDAASTEFGLDEWPATDIELLKQALIDGQVPHRWEHRTLIVAEDAEHTVDDLLDAIEAGEVASLDENAEAPDGALHTLYVMADRIARDATDGGARTTLLALMPELSRDAPPYGLAIRAWGLIVERSSALEAAFENASLPDDLAGLADELRTACRPYV